MYLEGVYDSIAFNGEKNGVNLCGRDWLYAHQAFIRFLGINSTKFLAFLVGYMSSCHQRNANRRNKSLPVQGREERCAFALSLSSSCVLSDLEEGRSPIFEGPCVLLTHWTMTLCQLG